MREYVLPQAPDRLFIDDDGSFLRIHINENGEVSEFHTFDIREALTAYIGAVESYALKCGFTCEEEELIELKCDNPQFIAQGYTEDFEFMSKKAYREEPMPPGLKIYNEYAYVLLKELYTDYKTGVIPESIGESLKKKIFSKYVNWRKELDILSAAYKKQHQLHLKLGTKTSEAVKASKVCTDEELIEALIEILEICLEESVTSRAIRRNRERLKKGVAM